MPGIVEKIKGIWTPTDDELGYDEDYNILKEEERAKRSESKSNTSNNKVVNIHATTQLQVVVFKPREFADDTRGIADELNKMHTVVLNLENTPKDVSRRIIDFVSGVAYSNGGKIKRIATSTFIVTPYNVDLTGDDLLDELESNGVCF